MTGLTARTRMYVAEAMADIDLAGFGQISNGVPEAIGDGVSELPKPIGTLVDLAIPSRTARYNTDKTVPMRKKPWKTR